jgi:hypothetical protein
MILKRALNNLKTPQNHSKNKNQSNKKTNESQSNLKNNEIPSSLNYSQEEKFIDRMIAFIFVYGM